MIDLTNPNEIREYVISHIDDAIANEWIKVYYQPVIRSLTGKLCGAESLARCLVDTILQYAIQYNDEGKNYGVIVLRNLYHKRIIADYGEKFAGKVIREMGERIIECIGQTAAAGRSKESYFCILTYVTSRESLEELAKKLKEHVEEINSVEGKSVTVKIALSMRLRTDEGVKDENIYQQALDEVDNY